MNFVARIFRRKVMKAPVRTLRIDGVKTALTPKPDDAELAATALLESRINTTPPQPSRGRETNRRVNHSPSGELERGSVAYYQNLSEKIKAAHEQERHAAMRYVSYVEEQLSTPLSTQGGVGGGSGGSIASLEAGLYQHQNAVEREGGELKQRWQKCLALVIVRQYKTKTNTDLTDGAD